MSSIRLKNWRRTLALFSVFALIFMYAPAISSAETATVYHETFETGKGVAVQSGGASLTHVTDKVFEGNSDGAALYVGNRVNNWDAADFGFTDMGLENGKTYTITVKGFVDSDAVIPEGAQAFLQCVDSYAWLAGANYTVGGAFTLTGTYTVDTGKDSKLRVQSNDAGAVVPFYIGDILITGEPAVTEKQVYHESFASGKGVAVQSGGASLTQVTDKVFEGNDDAAALYVSNRVNNWDAVDFRFADTGLANGKTYTIKVTGYVDADVAVTTGAGAALQTDKTYAWLAGTDFAAGQAFVLTREYTVDTTTDTAIRIQSNEAGKAIPFYIGDILITEKVSSGGDDEPRPPALPFTAVTFEDQTTGGFGGRGGNETLTVTNEDNHTDGGSYCLKVEGREQAWNGPSLRVEKYIDQGAEYKVTAWVKTITPSSVQLQLSTQVGDGSGANYVNLQGKTISTADGWVRYEGTYRYNNVGSEYVTIYVESSNNATASFYIDDISFVPTGSGPIDIQRDLVPIKDAYQNDFLIGDAIAEEDLQGVRLDLLKMHCNIATAGNAMKPLYLQPSKGNFDFSAADRIVDKVLAEGLKMHGHVLVWHSQTGAWMNTTTDSGGNTIALGRDEALDNMRTHIKTVMEHFGDKVISWDVVNEAMNDSPSNPADWKASLRRSPWYNAIGDDYVEQAFLAAREVLDQHPEWKPITLYYNDYNDDNQSKATAIYNMVKELNDRYALTHPGKLLIDGVGMQAHYNMSTNPANVLLSLERFLSLGVKVGITELDIQAGSNYQLSDKQAIAQGYLYAQLLKIFRDHAANIERVTFWGLDDGTSWRSSTNPTPFDKNLQAKKAYYGVIDPDKYMAENIPEPPPEVYKSTAGYATPVIDGTADAVWNDTPAMPISRYQMALQGANGTAKALWDEKNLYVLVQVSDAQLDKTSANAWEQDSVEAFVDENNGKTSYYENDDGQYRINFDNETSFNPAAIAEGFESKTSISGTNYTVEMKIPFKTITPANDVKIGFDVQINDGNNGLRQSAATWNDLTGNAYQDTSVYGVVTLTGYDPDIAIVEAAVTAIVGGTYLIPFTSQTSQETKNAWVQAAANALIPGGNGSVAVVTYDGGYIVTVTKGQVARTAEITVTEQPSPVNLLKGLTLSSGTIKPDFSGKTLCYSANVPNSITKIKVTPVLEDIRASMTVNGCAATSGQPSQDIALKVGYNTVSIVVTAQDGNHRTYKVTVNRLMYNFMGFLSPIKPDGSAVFKAGSVIPVKFQLKSTAGYVYPYAIAKVYIAKVTNGTVGAEKPAQASGWGYKGNLCRYDLFNKQYVFNLNTKGFTKGTYRIRADLGDGLTYTVNINLKDKTPDGRH